MPVPVPDMETCIKQCVNKYRELLGLKTDEIPGSMLSFCTEECTRTRKRAKVVDELVEL